MCVSWVPPLLAPSKWWRMRRMQAIRSSNLSRHQGDRPRLFRLRGGFCSLLAAGYWPRRESASRMGALEILIAPPNGLFNSSMRKIEPDTDSAQMSKVARTVALRGANNAKLKKMMAIQKTNIASNSVGIELSASEINKQTVVAISTQEER